MLTGLIYGRAGLREFLSQLLKWRVAARWYAMALLTGPLLMMAVLLTLSLFVIPELKRHYGVISTGLFVGVLWGAWHLLVYLWTSGTVSGGAPDSPRA